MFVAILQFELLIPAAASIKDKRRVIRSVKDRLHRDHLVAVAEVSHLDNMNVAGMALAAVNRDQRYLQGVIDSILDKLRKLPDAELGDVSREVLHGSQLPGESTDDQGRPLWTDAEKRPDAPRQEGLDAA